MEKLLTDAVGNPIERWNSNSQGDKIKKQKFFSHKHSNNFHRQLDKYGRKHRRMKNQDEEDILNTEMKGIIEKDLMTGILTRLFP